MQLFQKLYESLKPYHSFISSNTAILAYSGGKDSRLLLEFYNYLYISNLSPPPILFHLNHNIRDTRDEVKEIHTYLKANFPNFMFIYKSSNILKLSKRIKKSLEETGRLVRYKHLNQLSKKCSGYILTAHHIEDYLETVLINLIRGSGEAGLRSLPVYSNNIFRPFMLLPREEMRQILEMEKWQVFEDETNYSQNYLRNRLRITLTPLLYREGLNPSKLYKNFHNSEEPFFSHQRIEIPTYIKVFLEPIECIQTNTLKKILDNYLSILNLHPIRREILLELQTLLQNHQSFTKENVETYFWKSEKSPLYIIPKKSGVFQNPRLNVQKDKIEIEWNNSSKNYPSYLTLNVFSKGLKIKSGKIHKEISEILRTAEIPFPVRPYIPILFNSNEPEVILLSLWNRDLKDFFSR